MRERDRTKHRGDGSELLGEMMLAKAVLEEKNETLDRQEQIIRELRARERVLRSEIERLGEENHRLDARLEKSRREWFERGLYEAVSEAVRLADDWEREPAGSGTNLSNRLIEMFKARYGLQVVEQAGTEIDPLVHQVVEVVRGEETERSFEVLSKGFKMAGRVIRPAMVRVSESK